MQRSLFCCASCDSATLVDLRVCMRCCVVACSSCIIISSEAHVKKKQKSKTLAVEILPRDRDVQPSTCRSCRRRAVLVSLFDVSVGVARLFKATARQDTVTLECIVCGAPPFRNRTCPQCGIILCSCCFDEWQQRSQGSDPNIFSCVHCRQSCNADQYVHDRLIAKITSGRCQRDLRGPKRTNAEVASTSRKKSPTPSRYHICARIICGLAVFPYLAILVFRANDQGHSCSKNKLGSRYNLQQLVSQEAGGLQEWLADEGARSLIHCENEVPTRFQNLPWGWFACAWASGSQGIQEHWKLIRDELFAIAGCVRMQSMLTKELLGALYAVEVRLAMNNPATYAHFFHAMHSIGGPISIEEQNFERISKVATNFSYASFYLALAFAKQGKWQHALTQTNKCLAQNYANIECELLKVKMLKRLHMPIEGSLQHDRVVNCDRAMDQMGKEPNYTYMLRGYTRLSSEPSGKGMTGWVNSRFASVRAAKRDA